MEADEVPVLAALSKTLKLTDRLIKRSSGDDFWKPRPGSVFDCELQNTERDANGAPWGPDEPTMAFEAARVSLMYPIRDHLGSMRKLLKPNIPTLGHAVLARSIFESAGFAFWMADPQITVRSRVARIYAVLWEIAKTNVKQSPPGDAAAQAHLASILARISELGFKIVKVNPNKPKSPEIIDECGQIPTKTKWVENLFAGDIRSDYAKIYSPYSGIAHGELAALMTRRFVRPGVDPVFSIEERQLTENIELSLAAIRPLYKRVCIGGMGTMGMGGEHGVEYRQWEHNVGRRLIAVHKAIDKAAP